MEHRACVKLFHLFLWVAIALTSLHVLFSSLISSSIDLFQDPGRDFKRVGFDNRKERRTALVTVNQSLVLVSVGHNILRKFCNNVYMHGRFVR